MAVKIQGGGSTAGQPNVDANYNLNVALPRVKSQSGYSTLLAENDAGISGITGASAAPYVENIRATEDQRLSVGQMTLNFTDTFNMTAHNTNLWKFSQGTTTMAATLGAGFLTLNSGSVLTTAAACSYSTGRIFETREDGQLEISFISALSAPLVANQIHEMGLFISTATGASPTAPTDGVYFQWTTAGLIGVVNYNGTPTQVGPFTGNIIPSANQNQLFRIIISSRTVEFWAQPQTGPTTGELVFLGELMIPVGSGSAFLSDCLPFTLQSRNTGTVSGTPGLLKVASVSIQVSDPNLNIPYATQQCLQGLSGSAAQNGATMGSTAIYSNAAVAAAAALTNTTAAAGNTGLGGVALVLPTLTSGTDGILFSYLNPIGGVNQSARQLVITGVCISSGVQTVLVGGQLNLVFGVAYGHTALSLATTESASFVSPTTKAPRRIPIGIQNYIAAAAAGSAASDLDREFFSPIVINPGEYVAITMRNLGVVTTTGALAIAVTFDCYWV